jgi:hypothetical protein
LLAPVRMETTLETPTRSSALFDRETTATVPHGSAKLRKVLFGVAMVAAPAAVGAVVGLLARSRKAGLIAGGVTAAGLAVYRWQLERTFNDEPAYEVEQRIGDIEIRRYPARVEARTVMGDAAIDDAISNGFKRLAEYIFGANAGGEKLGMTTPVFAKRAGIGHHVSFVMPIHRELSSLPAPNDRAIELVEVPRQRVAVLCFGGKRTPERIAEKSAELKRLVSEASIGSKGEAGYAGFDPPWTLPLLRRHEVWLDLFGWE